MMIFLFKSFFLSLFILLSTTSICSNTPFIETMVSPNQLLIGDIFTYSIDLKLQQDTSLINVPQHADFSNIPALSFVDSRVTKSSDSGFRYIRLEYDFQIFDLDQHSIPTQHITIKSSSSQTNQLISVPPVSFAINSLKPPDVMDIQLSNYIFVEKNLNWLPIIVFLIIMLLSCFGLFKLINYLRRASKPNSAPPPVIDNRSPYEKVTESLLNNFNQRSSIPTKDYYVRFSDIIKTYLSTLLSVSNVEMTSFEILALCYDRFNEQDYRRIKKLLNFSDSVKFAQVPAQDDDNQNYYKKALDCLSAIHHAQSLSSDLSHEAASQPSFKGTLS